MRFSDIPSYLAYVLFVIMGQEAAVSFSMTRKLAKGGSTELAAIISEGSSGFGTDSFEVAVQPRRREETSALSVQHNFNYCLTAASG
jgi:hypothetical protein